MGSWNCQRTALCSCLEVWTRVLTHQPTSTSGLGLQCDVAVPLCKLIWHRCKIFCLMTKSARSHVAHNMKGNCSHGSGSNGGGTYDNGTLLYSLVTIPCNHTSLNDPPQVRLFHITEIDQYAFDLAPRVEKVLTTYIYSKCSLCSMPFESLSTKVLSLSSESLGYDVHGW